MEHRSHSNGLQTFLERWGFLLIAVVALLASQALMFFTRLTGAPWARHICSCHPKQTEAPLGTASVCAVSPLDAAPDGACDKMEDAWGYKYVAPTALTFGQGCLPQFSASYTTEANPREQFGPARSDQLKPG
jgi:hypothetical protein